jgi:hypothetical protein
MADNRTLAPFQEGIDGAFVTFDIDASTITYDKTKAGGSASVGLAVNDLAGDHTVQLVSDGEPVLGKLMKVEPDGKCSVQMEGIMALPAGASITVVAGKKVVGALGASSAKGYIRNPAAPGGTYVQATAVDNANARGMVYDASTQTACLVDF